MDMRGVLEKLYPQVDRRIIRATAMEHKDDFQAAVDFIEDEVLEGTNLSMEVTQIMARKDEEFMPLEESISSQGALVSSEEQGLWKSASSSMQAVDCETIEQLIEQTKSDKQKLMVSIQDMKELRRVAEQAEAAARLAKVQVLEGAQALEAKKAEIRKKIAIAREENAVHLGEVYGEKAILGTEAKELFSRVQQVRSEWLKASDILDEMKTSLQERINAAKEDQRVAEEGRLEREAVAREALQKEEDVLAQVLQEAVELDAEAGNCTKLREFLMKQGTVVDSLHGEISILHEDVELLKKKVDGLVVDSFHSASPAGSTIHWEPELITDIPSARSGDNFTQSVSSTSSSIHEKLSSSSSGSWQFLETEQ